MRPARDPGRRTKSGCAACTIEAMDHASPPAGGDVLQTPPPRFDPAGAAAIAHEVFGIRATATPLVSERDQNFRLAAGDGRGWVLKVSNPGEQEGVVEMEVGVVRHIARVDRTLPVLVDWGVDEGGHPRGIGGVRRALELRPHHNRRIASQ